jgi:site-specific recombinase XerD
MQSINNSPHTIRNYGYDFEQFISYLRNEQLPMQMDTELFKKTCHNYFLSLETYYNQDLKEDLMYGENSINRKRSSIRSFVRFLFRMGYITEDFSEQIEFNRTLPPPPHVLLSGHEIQEILRIHDQRIAFGKTEDLRFMHRRNKVAFVTLLETGIKVWELLILKWGNIHFDEHHIVIPKRNSIETRVVSFSSYLTREFYEYLEHIKKLDHYDESFLEGYLFFGAGKSPTYAINPKTIERMIDSLVKEACIENKNVTSQSLRHTMANYQIEQAKSISELTPILGYSRKSVTKHMYQKNH